MTRPTLYLLVYAFVPVPSTPGPDGEVSDYDAGLAPVAQVVTVRNTHEEVMAAFYAMLVDAPGIRRIVEHGVVEMDPTMTPASLAHCRMTLTLVTIQGD